MDMNTLMMIMLMSGNNRNISNILMMMMMMGGSGSEGLNSVLTPQNIMMGMLPVNNTVKLLMGGPSALIAGSMFKRPYRRRYYRRPRTVVYNRRYYPRRRYSYR